MSFFRQWGQFMAAGARAHARWELEISNNILNNPRRLILLGLLMIPVLLGGITFADDMGNAMPELLGGKKAYSPAFYSTPIFLISIFIGLGAGLITGCIGAGGGFIIAPALMSAGIKGILAVGTDLFHIFAKAIMGSVIHRKLGVTPAELLDDRLDKRGQTEKNDASHIKAYHKNGQNDPPAVKNSIHIPHMFLRLGCRVRPEPLSWDCQQRFKTVIPSLHLILPLCQH